MRIVELKSASDQYAMELAQGRTLSHVTRNTYFTWFNRKGENHMALKDKLAAKAAALRNKKTSAPAAKTTKTTSAKSAKSNGKAKVAKTRGDIPWGKIKSLYEAGKSTAEISDSLGLTRKKTKDGKKENPYPYYLTVGYLTKLARGVEVDGKKLSIKRGK